MNLLKNNFPGLIVYPATEDDLRSAVAFAFKYRIRVVARCSGHDFNSRSSGYGVMLIKTKNLSAVAYDPAKETVTFGAGANHGIVYAALAPLGRVYIGGQAKTVCPAGCLSGGCHGLLTRQHGLGADNVLSIRLILYNGTAVTLSPTSHSSLFYAYLGAGANTFGLAASFTARTHPAPEVLLQFKAQLNMFAPNGSGLPPTASALSTFFMNVSFMQALPINVAGNIRIEAGLLNVDMFYLGAAKDAAASVATIAPIFQSPFVVPGSTKNFTWPTLLDLALNNYPPATSIWARKFITNVLVPPKQEALTEAIDTITSRKPTMWLWFVYGGHVRNGSAPYVSQGMRAAMYEAEITTSWQDPNEDEDRMASVHSYLDVMYKVSPYTYINEYTSWGGKYNPMPDWKTRLFGDKYDELLKIKKTYDPCNAFVAQFGIGSDLPQMACKVRK
ncbi:hypothetical protein GPECTOR_2g1339 [Gonium pectorale]|uniref:FAD-binding PCMH-type domain-containing protein n=1 Tax=Gonium pectorale TaxID=33097 RepID=A0A150H0Y6_GONPE|nr:hypothetical protein GPECTOR_2g1339 [Gonium pectorale]|eukprot:KXZ55789.1 hypothetical protein GPECTOR_2g1339 [Gonium pectorale]